MKHLIDILVLTLAGFVGCAPPITSGTVVDMNHNEAWMELQYDAALGIIKPVWHEEEWLLTIQGQTETGVSTRRSISVSQDRYKQTKIGDKASVDQ